ncbi:MAG: bifunctional chorismate mutase/prephenate dehydratase [Firmicutes bacterium HGW-Firmicutes-16]|nr:MAG: bifunctional chorismate mutase/prephenate dehydratase [Firmicutes bacterium HGW-Firmicutes-16]
MDKTEIRKQIDEVDDSMLSLFLKRMELADEMGAAKKNLGLPTFDREREREILAKVSEKSGNMEPYAFNLFSTLFKLSKSRQNELLSVSSNVRTQIERALSASEAVFPRSGTVACQGIEGSNSQAACEKLLTRANIVYVKTFEAVFDAVDSGLCAFGVLPIENSSSGSVRSIYKLLQNRNFSVVRSTKLCIRHELLAKPGAALSDIKEIYSHEQAINQCGKFLSSLKDVKVIPCGNTALAAKMISESNNPHIAALSSHACAELYGLTVVSDSVQDSENNYTRFICITKEPKIYDGANKLSMIFVCDNKPGALYDIISKPAILGINMNKLESCPVSGRNFEFVFFLDLDASVREPLVMSMLEDLERSCETFVFLGNYEEV